MDEVRLWNYARKESDLAANANNELTGGEAGLVAYYDFSDGSGSFVSDKTIGDNDGTIYGDPTWTTTGPTLDPAPAVNIYDLELEIGTNSVNLTNITLQDPADLYYVITTSPTQPSAAQIIAGQDHTGSTAYNYNDYGSLSAQSYSFSDLGNTTFTNGNDLVSNTTYYIYFVADDGIGGYSTILAQEFTTLSLADVTFNTLSVPASDLIPGSTNNLIYGWQMDVATTSIESQGYLFDLTGTFDSADFAINAFQLWENTTNDFGSASPVGTRCSIDTAGNPGGAMIALIYNQTYTAPTTTYFWVTADMAAGATNGNTFSIIEPETSSFNTFNFTNPINYIGSGVTAGSVMTIGTPAPVPTITSFSPSSGPVATTVTITGTNFDPTFANNTVYLDGVAVSPTGGNATSLTFDIPAQVTSVVEISVLNSSLGTMSNSSHSIVGVADRLFTVTNPTPYQPFFGAKTDYFTGASQSPRDIITGDFNLDGVLDLATLNSQFGEISVAIGVGDGTFNTPTNYSISSASNTFNMDMGDFNGDGYIDIVASGSNPSPALHIMLGDGSGAFSSPATSSFALNASPGDIAVADFNTDGYLDVVVI